MLLYLKKHDATADVELQSFMDGLPTRKNLRVKVPRWKNGVRYCAIASCVVSLMNTIFLLVGEGRAGFPPLSRNDGRRTLHDGPCDNTKKINIGVHLIINILGSIILGVSNYCMQCMNAPTRTEVDQAHSNFRWVDIGIPSLRNLDKISGLGVVLWLLLGSSSVPLHLLYVSILTRQNKI
jgi:hypothetical protein